MVNTVIVGTGDLAYGLAHLFKVSNTEAYGNTLAVTKPGLKQESVFHDTGVKVVGFNDALLRANIVVLAIPSYALKDFVGTYASELQDKIIVDPTNSRKPGQDLYSILADTDVRWVKAFNDIGAVDVLLKRPESKKKVLSKMCSPDLDALKSVKEFAESSLGFSVKIVPFENFPSVEQHQNSIGGDWVLATWIMIIVFIICQIYNIIRHPVAKGYPWYSFPLFCMNKAISWAAITGFALAQLPGVCARFSNSIYRDTLRDKPKCLRNFLDCRKHLGLISLWFLAVHIFMSCLMFGPNYYGRFFVDPTDALSRMNLNGELSFMFGSFAAALYCILGICSLPSLAELMTNKQWKLVYGPIAWTALLFGTLHVICQGAGITWDKKERWPWGLPPITLMSTVFPMFVLALKIVQLVFSWSVDLCGKKKVYGYEKMGKSLAPALAEESGSSDTSDLHKKA